MALAGAVLGVVGLGIAIKPLKPFLLADHPVLLGFVTGDLVAIGAGAAFARIGEAPLWLVIAAGAVGMVKFDWLTWWAGRLWGAGIVRMFTTSERARRFAARATQWNPWILRLAVVIAVLPGVPTPVVYATAGWARMRLLTFVLLNFAGAALMTTLVAGLGYSLGQGAVDLVLLIDSYASIGALTMISVALLIPVLKRWIPGRLASERAAGVNADRSSEPPTRTGDAPHMSTHSDTRIREATPADADVVQVLVGEIAAHQNQSKSVTTTVARWRDLLSRDDVLVLLAERDNETLGYVSVVRRLNLWSGQDVLALDDLYVRSHVRSLGVGRALMVELVRRNAREQLTITWGVQPDNEDALRFYDRLGATLRPKVVAKWPAIAQRSVSVRT